MRYYGWARAVYVVGGTTGESDRPEREAAELARFCHRLGAAIARSGADLIACPHSAHSADYHTLLGYAASGSGRAIHVHSPRDPITENRAAELRALLGRDGSRLLHDWHYPGPDGSDLGSARQAWLLCRLMALDHADVVISVGGRTSTAVGTLLHLAEARGKPVVPFAFLGGASRQAYARSTWRHQAGLGFDRLRYAEAVDAAMDIADAMLAARLRSGDDYEWPPRRVFISRARADEAYATAAGAYLTAAGFDIMLGEKDLGRNQVVEAAIDEAVLRADLFIVLWSRAYAASRFCYDELELALRRHRTAGLRLWLINLDGSDVVPPDARGFPQTAARTPDALVRLLDDLLRPAPT